MEWIMSARDRPPSPQRAMPQPVEDLAAAVHAFLPDVDHDTALVHLTTMRLGRIVESILDQTLRSQGIDRSGHSVMTALWFAGPPHQLSPTQLSWTVVQTTSGMTKTIRRLEQAGLVERTPDPTDGRGQLVRLTRPGLRLVEQHTRELVTRWDEHLAGHHGRTRAELTDALWSLLAAVDPLRERGDPSS